MAEKKQFKHRCELFVLQCTPDLLKGERVNVGLVLRDTNDNDPTVLVRVCENLKRLNCLEPGFDVAAFEEMLHQTESLLVNTVDFERRIDHFEDWPEELVVAPKMAVLTDSLPDELERLEKQYLDPRDWDRPKNEEETRASVVRQMRNCFEQAGVWRLMDKRLPVAEFTRRGDTLKLDCGYVDRVNSAYRIFHALPLAKDGNVVKALAYSWPMIRNGIAEQKQLTCNLRVIVSDTLDRNDDAIAFGWETLERAGLQIEPLSRVPQFAEEARLALGA